MLASEEMNNKETFLCDREHGILFFPLYSWVGWWVISKPYKLFQLVSQMKGLLSVGITVYLIFIPVLVGGHFDDIIMYST